MRFTCYSVWVMFFLACEGFLHKQLVCPSHEAYLGAEINLGFLEEQSASYERIIDIIKDSLLSNGIVVIRNQTMDRAEQCRFTQKFGSMIKVPESFGGVDPEPGLPAVRRITNYFHNGTWKGDIHSFGSYWHRDEDYYSADYIASVLYASKVVRTAAATMFLDTCAAYDLIPADLRARIKDTVFRVSVRDISDFKDGKEEDYLLFANSAKHGIFYTHPGSGRRCLYMTNELLTVRSTTESERRDLQDAWNIMISQAPKYNHYWTEGDVIMWDNLAVMHKAGEKRPGYSSRDPRILFKTAYHVTNITRENILG